MTCYRPVAAWPPKPASPNRSFVYSPHKSYAGAVAIDRPCGQCIGCRIDKARDWGTRMAHERQMHEDSWFITLTYSPEHLPGDGSLCKRHITLFLKRLRKHYGPFRFYLSGEYGDKFSRPHYHLILFGPDIPDRVLYKKSPSGFLLYRSETLERIWGMGSAEFGFVTVETCEYTARYAMKKITGKSADDHYRRAVADPLTGDVTTWKVIPEFATMSVKPGIGSTWFDHYASDCFPSDFIVINGRKRPVPEYYARKLSEMARIKLKADRRVRARAHRDNNTDQRLNVREQVRELKVKRLERVLDRDGAT